MKLDLLPDFAKPYKKKGYDIRFVNNKYQLFKISSKRVENKKYPILVQEYIGTIDSSKGLILKKTTLSSDLVEYGFSNFILSKYKRMLIRSIFNGSNDSIGLIYLAIINFMYKHYEERFINLSYLSNYKEKYESFLKLNIESRVNNLTTRIESLLDTVINNKDDKDFLIESLKNIKVSRLDLKPKITYSDELLELFKKYRINIA